MTCWIHQSLLRLRLQDASLPMIRRTGLSAHAKEFTPLAAEIAPVSSVLTAGSDHQVADQLAEHHEHERNEGTHLEIFGCEDQSLAPKRQYLRLGSQSQGAILCRIELCLCLEDQNSKVCTGILDAVVRCPSSRSRSTLWRCRAFTWRQGRDSLQNPYIGIPIKSGWQ